MKPIGDTFSRTCLAVALAGLSIACSGSGNETDTGENTPVAGETFERRLVDREYPFTTSDGSGLICGEWEIVSAAGEVVNVAREFYPIKSMNRHLQNVGTPDAVAEVDADFKSALLESGISQIESCEDARTFVNIGKARIQWRSPSELELPSEVDSTEHGEPGLLEQNDDEVTDEVTEKIINGESFDHPSTVGFAVTGIGLCTGTLIGPFAMLTAAHCVQTTGFKEIRVWIKPEGGTERCISHFSVAGPCPSTTPETAVNNAYAQVHPNWVGLGHDQAVVIMSAPWLPPANVQARWSRVAANWGYPLSAALNSSPVRIAGYGHSNQAGTGIVGVGRRGVSTHTISSINAALTRFSIARPTAASSGICHGDSGLGPYNTTLLGGTNLTLGTLSAGTGPNGQCQDVGTNATYMIPDGAWISNVVSFFNGACSTISNSGGLAYIKCF